MAEYEKRMTDRQRASGAAAADRLRDRIDRGGTGDKVAFTDPAAAPLGTDDEAAGTAPTMAQVDMAEAHEASRGAPRSGKPTIPERQNRASGRTTVIAMVVAVGLAGVALALWFG
ncbi:MAG: hypothetical protein CL814_15825 [Confluentimicrobium sp.]|jgi:hypothetical protein|uniref:hypothetical protein n=1 Tax=Actibacterium sp. TaxID=1872125 RepID=UPI000C60946A|nr:hypothetical protein [Actibacterium sp.]MBC58385.1 hypothetical protein [Actibacterium sp.]MDY6860731.1 hypothetical protein [Pseudomonadota bacterium]